MTFVKDIELGPGKKSPDQIMGEVLDVFTKNGLSVGDGVSVCMYTALKLTGDVSGKSEAANVEYLMHWLASVLDMSRKMERARENKG